MNIKIADIVNDSIVDGIGLRLTVFTQGCCHNCNYCHNPSTHPLDGGKDIDIDEIIKMVKANPILDGITISGGEPFLQPLPCLELSLKAKELGLSVWIYTGFTYEEILFDSDKASVLKYVDVLIDGKFESDKQSYLLNYKGSSNQRIIDVQKSSSTGKVIEYIL